MAYTSLMWLPAACLTSSAQFPQSNFTLRQVPWAPYSPQNMPSTFLPSNLLFPLLWLCQQISAKLMSLLCSGHRSNSSSTWGHCLPPLFKMESLDALPLHLPLFFSLALITTYISTWLFLIVLTTTPPKIISTRAEIFWGGVSLLLLLIRA